MVHLSFNERLTAREDIAVEDDEGLPDDAAWHLTARASSTASQRDELPHATTKGGFLADLCVVAAAFRVVVDSHGAQRRGWVSRHYTTVKSRADVTSASKADEAADAEESVFESQPIQSIAAVSRKARRTQHPRPKRRTRVLMVRQLSKAHLRGRQQQRRLQTMC